MQEWQDKKTTITQPAAAPQNRQPPAQGSCSNPDRTIRVKGNYSEQRRTALHEHYNCKRYDCRHQGEKYQGERRARLTFTNTVLINTGPVLRT